MLINFFKVTLRNLRRNSLYSFINISGLAIGISCSILILLWVRSETSYDKFLPKADRLHQVWVNATFDNSVVSWTSVPLPTYEELKSRHAKIVNTAVVGWGDKRLIAREDNGVMKDGYFVSEEYLEMFEFPLLAGNPSTVLDDPSSIVITESLAEIMFKDEDPMGQFLEVNEVSTLKVTGILKDVPDNSSFQFDYLIPWKHRESIQQWVVDNKTNWGNYSFQVFAELAGAGDEAEVEADIKDLLTEKGQTDIPREFFLHPMLRWKLHSNFKNGQEAGGQADYVNLFSAIALFVLIIACINFMNLATARSERRAREVGIRKSLGSRRGQLIMQFYGESMVITLISYALALLLVTAVLPAYNNLVNKNLFIDYASRDFWLFSGAIIFVTGIISGSYPSLYLSSFNPVKTLKGKISIGKNANVPRKILVMLQFGFAVFLIISTLVILNQINLAQNRELGYDQEGLVTTPFHEEVRKNYDVIYQDLLRTGDVVAMTRSNSQVTSVSSNNFLDWPGKPEAEKVMFVTVVSGYDYAKTMGVDVILGRDFSKEFASDSSGIIVNKAGLELMGLEDPLGTPLTLWGQQRPLVGVIDNILMGSPYEPVRPMMLFLDDWGGAVTIRLKPTQDMTATMKRVQAVFEKHNPAYPFEYSFVDVNFQQKYTTINLTRRLATIFAVLTIFITGLGLFGLASYTAEQRIKEIGIRKVLGASVGNLMILISREFTFLTMISFAIFSVVAWYALNQWLNQYTIRVDVEWWVFVVTGLVSLLFTLAIVSNQARRAAVANPVNSLRNE